MPMDLVLVLKWVKSFILCTLYIIHLYGKGDKTLIRDWGLTFTDSCLGQVKPLGSSGVSPGLVVMGGGSRSEGLGFKSWRCILAEHDIFSH